MSSPSKNHNTYMGDIILLSVVLEIKKIFLQIICFQTDWVYLSFHTKEQAEIIKTGRLQRL